MKQISWTDQRLEALRKHPQQHKYDHGHLLVLSGPRFQTGAARMAARAALRVGAGLVTLGASRDAMVEMAPALTEVMLTEIGGDQNLAGKLQRDQRINALCLGPGLGLGEEAEGLVWAALSSGRACVLDADALTLIGRLPALREMLHPACVLTPHEGEFARLYQGEGDMTRRDRIMDAARQLGCTVLLKGAQTMIAAPEGESALLDSLETKSAPWLATAGAGDVLAGLIAGLLARGNTPSDAAETGAILHVEAAQRCGPGLIAGDLVECIPQVLRELGV